MYGVNLNVLAERRAALHFTDINHVLTRSHVTEINYVDRGVAARAPLQ
jgi:hypothetical protein